MKISTVEFMVVYPFSQGHKWCSEGAKESIDKVFEERMKITGALYNYSLQGVVEENSYYLVDDGDVWCVCEYFNQAESVKAFFTSYRRATDYLFFLVAGKHLSEVQ